MLVVRSKEELLASNCAARLADSFVCVTAGNFDGMHLGHAALLRAASVEASARAATDDILLICLSFAPHPKRVLSGISPADRNNHPELLPLMRPREKVVRLEAEGFSMAYIPRFTKRFSQTTAEEFVSEYLNNQLRSDLVVVGHDWAFGRGREGTTERLSELATSQGIEVVVVPPVELHGKRISSSLVRENLRAGETRVVEELLGRRYSLVGRVVRGEARGRTIGYPTLNLRTSPRVLPKNGVYATFCRLAGKLNAAVTNIGERPTFNGTERSIETYILDKDIGERYGERIELEFVSRVRDEIKFDSVAALRQQIERDVARARELCAAALERR